MLYLRKDHLSKSFILEIPKKKKQTNKKSQKHTKK